MPTVRLPGPVAVIDLETTGLFPGRHDRVIELAAVVVGTSGEVEREFVSLVNPGRDIGPSRIHGLTSRDLLGAPTFAEVAAVLVEHLDGSVAVAAHNLRFDRLFLESEFARLGSVFPGCEGLCTMELGWGGSLASCCEAYGVSFPGDAHHALADARAAADLLVRLLSDQPDAVARLTSAARISWPTFPRTDRGPVTRDQSRRRQSEPPTYLQRLLGLAHDLPRPTVEGGAALAYENLLDRVLEDRHVDETEGEELVAAAQQWGLAGDQVQAVHMNYLARLARAAAADGVVTDAERRDLELVARLLGVDRASITPLLDRASEASALPEGPDGPALALESLAGKRVCFTGEMLCRYNGAVMTRELCTEFATRAGLTVVDSVTKKLDLLVVADPHTQSGKAKKARQYGVRVLHESVFWRAAGVPVE